MIYIIKNGSRHGVAAATAHCSLHPLSFSAFSPAAAVGDRDCCVVRLGDAMAVARMTGSVLWSPSNMTLSLIRQAKVGIAGPSICRLSDAGKTAMERAGDKHSANTRRGTERRDIGN